MRSESSCAYRPRNSRRSLKRRSMRKNGTAPTTVDEVFVTDNLSTFLLEQAKRFRELASQRPELQNELRRMAEECAVEAARLSQERRRRAGLPIYLIYE